ncbi:hypothetical protein CBM2587_U30008 [Cupriavidus taiwanensis]|uniref:Uncharacterized protein n=1 Tax=Cupriavidus taiwanensis TaxID=164546 RepID=A0A375CJU9_9BURK|nr:hypothetical protein CBM2587_U30008 [Cupriavidus taiwanensis]
MVRALGICLAVRQAERTLVSALVATASRHIGTGFGHCRRRAAAFHLIAATGTGVRGRCQLDCQKHNEKEAGEPGMPADRVTQEFFAVGVIVARILSFAGNATGPFAPGLLATWPKFPKDRVLDLPTGARSIVESSNPGCHPPRSLLKLRVRDNRD